MPSALDLKLADLFARGDVFADRWTTEVREKLDVADPLTALVVKALDDGRNVVLTGNAGDGKSHLAMTALAQARARPRLTLTRQNASDTLPDNGLLFIRDASALTDDVILEAANRAAAAGVPVLVTINEGPLATLARADPEGFFARVREVSHGRARGEDPTEPADTLIVNLAGRQLARGAFLYEALARLLPNVVPCSVCASAMDCVRVIGAGLLAQSPRAQERLVRLIQLVTDAGNRLSARDLWTLLIDLFYGWTCPSGTEANAKVSGYWWMRIFDSELPTARAISDEFDPIHAPAAVFDTALWVGNFGQAGLPAAFPGATPAREELADGLQAFRSAKRARFFFASEADLHVDDVINEQSEVPEYVALVSQAMDEPEYVVEDLVQRVNQFRLRAGTGRELLLSRHHVMSANKRPHWLAYSESAPSTSLRIMLPYRYDDHGIDDAGFWPPTLQLTWRDGGGTQALTVDYRTWQLLKRPRGVLVDRDQETLDHALDLFLGQAPVSPSANPEVVAVEHSSGRTVRVRVRTGRQQRSLEVL